MKLFTFFHTLLVRLLLFILIVIAIIPICIIMLLPEHIRFSNRILFWVLNFFYWAVIKCSFVPIRYEGVEYIPKEPVIFAANHQSSIDIPLIGVLPHGKPHVWLARAELLKTRLLRFVIKRLAVVADVTSREKSTRSLIRLLKLVEGQDIDVMIFPEGSRFTDDEVHEFFGGFVILAKALKRPVVPVRIFGANRVYPPHTFLVHYHPIKVVIGKPMHIEEGESDEQFKQRVYEWFIEQTG